MRRLVPVLEWLPHYRRADLSGDVVAGVTGAAVIVPQSMAYARIAGLPPVVGLYASVVPLLVYAALGRSRQLGVGPLASISILSALGVSRISHGDTAEFIALSATLAVLVGVVHIVIGVARLGFVVRFLSEPVMKGFLAAVGVLLVCTQLGPMTNIDVPNSDKAYEIVIDWLERVDDASLTSLALALVSVAVMLWLKRWPRFPGALVLIVVSSLAVVAFDLEEHGIAIVGHVPSGIAGFDLPPLHGDQLAELLPAALAITFVSILESLALARDYADRHDYEIETNQEIAALGASNVAAGVFQGMVVTGAISRSSILEEVGARTQLSGALTGIIVAPLLLFGTSLFRPIPIAVLSAVVIVAVIGFVDVGEARRLWRVQQADFWMAMTAFVGTLVLGLEVGVLVAVALSIGLIVYRVTRPRFPELGRIPGTDYFLDRRRHPDAQGYPGTVVLGIDASLWFTNADGLRTRMHAIETGQPDVHTVVLDMSGVDHLDTTADHTLRKICTRSTQRGTRILFVNVDDEVRAVMDASGLSAMAGDEAFFATDADAVRHLDAR